MEGARREDLAKALGYSSEAEMLEDVRKRILEAKRAVRQGLFPDQVRTRGW